MAEEREPAFFALFEALNWAVALDDVIAETWRPHGEREGFNWRSLVDGGELLDGVRYARHRVHHQWADALRRREGVDTILPFRGHSWEWRDVEELPPAPPKRNDERGEVAYRAMVAKERRVAYTLTQLDAVFSQAMGFLESRRPVSPRVDGAE